MTAGQRRKAIGDCHHRSDALKRMPPRILTRPKGRDHRRRDREHAGKNRNSARTREAIVAGAKPAEKQWELRTRRWDHHLPLIACAEGTQDKRAPVANSRQLSRIRLAFKQRGAKSHRQIQHKREGR